MTVIRSLLTPKEIRRKYDGMEQRLTAAVSERMLDLGTLQPEMRVLDLATGRGEPAIRAAHLVAPTGRVLGIDLSDEILQMARERADREEVANLDLLVANAQSLEGVPADHFHATLARWCLMYFDSPVQALNSVRRAMLPGGRMVAAVWAEPERVPYFTFPRRVLEKFVPLPEIDPKGPGTFRYAELNELRRDFELAGFAIEHVEEQDVTVMEADTADEFVNWVRAFGLTRLLQGVPEPTQLAWEVELLKEAESFREAGVFRLGGVTRIVVASVNS